MNIEQGQGHWTRMYKSTISAATIHSKSEQIGRVQFSAEKLAEKHDWEKTGSAVIKHSANLIANMSLHLKFGRGFLKVGTVWTPGALIFRIYDCNIMMVFHLCHSFISL